LGAYEVQVSLSLPLVFVAYYFVYWSFFIVIAVKLDARNAWLALIPGIKIYLLRKMSGREYKTGRSLITFLLCFFAWVAALPLVVHYSSSGFLPNLVFWGGILLYLVYRGAMLASIAGRLGEPPWKAYLYAVPLVGFVFITMAAFSPRRTVHEQLRVERLWRNQPAYPHDIAATYQHPNPHLQQHQDYGRQYAKPSHAHGSSVCSFCGEVNPPEFSECQNCGSPLRAGRGQGWK